MGMFKRIDSNIETMCIPVIVPKGISASEADKEVNNDIIQMKFRNILTGRSVKGICSR